MKIAWYKSIVSFVAMLVLFACKQKPEPAANNDNNEIFSQNPALKTITDKVNDHPNNAGLYYQRGNILHSMKQDSLALKDFNKAVTLDSTRSEYYSAVGDLLFEHKDVSGSLKWIKKAIELNPEDPKARLKIAKLDVYLRDYPNAFKEINTVLRQDAMIPEAYFLKGMIYKDIKDSSNKALSSFLTAVQIMPDYKDALMQIGLLYDQQNDSLALKYYENAFRSDTGDVSPLYAKGMYYQARKRMEEAKNEYKKCITHDRNFADAYFSTGFILMQEDSFEKARRQFDLVTKISPNDAGAYYNRGLCSELMNDIKNAEADYEQALVFDKDYKEAKEGLKRIGG